MVASRIRGITVEIGRDTTGLDKALKSVNSTIKDIQSKLKDVEERHGTLVRKRSRFMSGPALPGCSMVRKPATCAEVFEGMTGPLESILIVCKS